MDKFINKILKETKEIDDRFFQPKDIKKRNDEIRKQKRDQLKKRRFVVKNVNSGLQNIRINYEDKNWESKEEKLFLQIFSKLHVSERYREYWNGYALRNNNDRTECAFDLKHDTFLVLYDAIWQRFIKGFNLSHVEIQSFMGRMLKKYFKLYEFTPHVIFF